jgi:hypothetical protein
MVGDLLQSKRLGDGLVALFITTAYALIALIEDFSLDKIGLLGIQLREVPEDMSAFKVIPFAHPVSA